MFYPKNFKFFYPGTISLKRLCKGKETNLKYETSSAEHLRTNTHLLLLKLDFLFRNFLFQMLLGTTHSLLEKSYSQKNSQNEISNNLPFLLGFPLQKWVHNYFDGWIHKKHFWLKHVSLLHFKNKSVNSFSKGRISG